MKRLFSALILITILSSCNDEAKMERAIQKSWAVESAEQVGSNETLQFGLNLLSFDQNYSCTLPALVGEKRCLADWKLEKEDDHYLLVITNCARDIFNGSFKLNYERLDGINRMTLTSSKIKMVCMSMQ